MRIQLWPVTFALVTVALGLAACAPPRPLPSLPVLDLATSQPAVRQVIETALTAARTKPDDAVVVARLGMALHAHHQLAAAARAYERAALLNPKQPDYLDYWGTTLAADGRYAEALVPLRASLNLRDSAPVRLRLADTYYANGQMPEARREYESLLASDGSLAAAHFGRGRCLAGAEAGAEAAAAFERAIELFPRYGAARCALAKFIHKGVAVGSASAAAVKCPIASPASPASSAARPSALRSWGWLWSTLGMTPVEATRTMGSRYQSGSATSC